MRSTWAWPIVDLYPELLQIVEILLQIFVSDVGWEDPRDVFTIPHFGEFRRRLGLSVHQQCYEKKSEGKRQLHIVERLT